MSMLRGIALRIINLTVILLVVLIVIAAVLSARHRRSLRILSRGRPVKW